jgi:hypothetical protein
MRSSGDRLISQRRAARLMNGGVKREDLHKTLYRLWRARSGMRSTISRPTCRDRRELDHAELLPATFMLLPPHSWHDDVWTDVARMRTLNGEQHAGRPRDASLPAAVRHRRPAGHPAQHEG